MQLSATTSLPQPVSQQSPSLPLQGSQPQSQLAQSQTASQSGVADGVAAGSKPASAADQANPVPLSANFSQTLQRALPQANGQSSSVSAPSLQQQAVPVPSDTPDLLGRPSLPVTNLPMTNLPMTGDQPDIQKSDGKSAPLATPGNPLPAAVLPAKAPPSALPATPPAPTGLPPQTAVSTAQNPPQPDAALLAKPSAAAGKIADGKAAPLSNVKKTEQGKSDTGTAAPPQVAASAAAQIPAAIAVMLPAALPGNVAGVPSSGAQMEAASGVGPGGSVHHQSVLPGGTFSGATASPDQQALSKTSPDSAQTNPAAPILAPAPAQVSAAAMATLSSTLALFQTAAAQTTTMQSAAAGTAPADTNLAGTNPAGTALAALPPGMAAQATNQAAAAMVAMGPGPDPGTQRLTISLKPLELGHVTIRIDRLADGSAAIAVSATHAATLATLHSDRPALEQALTQAGIPVAHRSFDFRLEGPNSPAGSAFLGQGSTAQGDTGQNSRPARNRGTLFALSTPEMEITMPRMRRYGVDLMA